MAFQRHTKTWKKRRKPGPKNKLEVVVKRVLIQRPYATLDDAYRKAKAIIKREKAVNEIFGD